MDIQEAMEVTSSSNRIWLKINNKWVEFYKNYVAEMWSVNPTVDHAGLMPRPMEIRDALLVIQNQFDGKFPEIPFRI